MLELSVTLMVRMLLVGWMFVDPPESLKSIVLEEPGCPKVERITLFKDTKVLLGCGNFESFALRFDVFNCKVIGDCYDG